MKKSFDELILELPTLEQNEQKLRYGCDDYNDRHETNACCGPWNYINGPGIASQVEADLRAAGQNISNAVSSVNAFMQEINSAHTRTTIGAFLNRMNNIWFPPITPMNNPSYLRNVTNENIVVVNGSTERGCR